MKLIEKIINRYNESVIVQHLQFIVWLLFLFKLYRIIMSAKLAWSNLIVVAALLLFRPSEKYQQKIFETYFSWLRYIKLPPVGYFLILYAFSGWPFLWSGHPALVQYSNLMTWILLLLICTTFFMRRDKLRGNIYSISFLAILTLYIISFLFTEYQDIRDKTLQRSFLYLFLFFAVTVMASIKYEELTKAANTIVLIYLIISLPSVVILLSFLFGIDLPYVNLALGGRSDLYRLYPFGVVMDTTIFRVADFFSIVRLNGFSEEPGVLGTYVVFFLILNRLVGEDRNRLIRERCLHVLGILSLSLFYFVSVFIMLFPKLIAISKKIICHLMSVLKTFAISKKVLALIYAAALSIFLFFVFLNAITGTPIYYLTVARLLPGDSGWMQGDSRSLQLEGILQYLRYSDNATILMGKGLGANSLSIDANFASWGSELYDSGLLVLIIICIFYGYLLFRSAYHNSRLNFQYTFLLLPAILSFYQRPEVIAPVMLIFWSVVTRFFSERSAAKKLEMQGL